MGLLVDDEQKAKENRERLERERSDTPYYWWEFPDPFEASEAPVSNPDGLARSRQDLINRREKHGNQD